VKGPTVTNPYAAYLLAETRGAELRQEAASARLAVLIGCCRPSVLTTAVRRLLSAPARLRAAIRRDELAACCVTA
jgi:hypothetical protein